MISEITVLVVLASVDVEMTVTFRRVPVANLSVASTRVAPPAYHFQLTNFTNLSITSKSSTLTEPLPSTWPRPILRSRHQPCLKRQLRPNRQGNKPRCSVSSPKPLVSLRPRHQVKNALKRVLCHLLLLHPVNLVRKRRL